MSVVTSFEWRTGVVAWCMCVCGQRLHKCFSVERTLSTQWANEQKIPTLNTTSNIYIERILRKVYIAMCVLYCMILALYAIWRALPRPYLFRLIL